MLDAMLFGDRDHLNHTLRLGFERTGSFHLFVVSGMHVALLAAGLFWIARRLRLHPFLSTFLALVLTTAYALLTGFGAPIQRALLMSAIVLGTQLLSRQRSLPNALGAALLGVLLLSPASLFESSLQMTFLVVLAIGGIALPLGEWTFLPYLRATHNLDALWNDRALPPHLAQLRIMLRLWGDTLRSLLPKGRLARKLARLLPAALLRLVLRLLELLLIGVVAELLMLLPMAVYFHRATLFSLPANVLSIPLVALLAPLAIATFLLSLASPWLSLFPSAVTALLLHGITSAIAHLSHLRSADWRIPGPPLAVSLAALLGWMLCAWAVRRSRRCALAAAASLPLIAALVLWPYPARTTPGTLEITAIDVGQGDSLLVVSPEGRTLLIDAGGPVGGPGMAPLLSGNSGTNPASTAFDLGFDVGEQVVCPYLWSRRIRRLDVVALTHAHSDHMGGMPAVLRNLRPRELWVGIDPASAAYTALLHQAAELGIRVRHLHAGDTPAWPPASSPAWPGDPAAKPSPGASPVASQLSIHVLAPAPGYTNPGAPINNDSLVLHLQYGRAAALLEGDAEAPSERAMLAAHAITPVTLLKVGHHGSRTSTLPELLAAAAPRDAVISVGRHNTFGHPRPEILSRLGQAHARLYRTDQFGLTQFLLIRDGTITEHDHPPQQLQP
jgi:competence protein ComEC